MVKITHVLVKYIQVLIIIIKKIKKKVVKILIILSLVVITFIFPARTEAGETALHSPLPNPLPTFAVEAGNKGGDFNFNKKFVSNSVDAEKKFTIFKSKISHGEIDTQVGNTTHQNKRYVPPFASMTNHRFFGGAFRKKDEKPKRVGFTTLKKERDVSVGERSKYGAFHQQSAREELGLDSKAIFQRQIKFPNRKVSSKIYCTQPYEDAGMNWGNKYNNLINALDAEYLESSNVKIVNHKMCKKLKNAVNSIKPITNNEKEMKSYYADFFKYKNDASNLILAKIRGQNIKTVCFLKLDTNRVNRDVTRGIEAREFLCENYGADQTYESFSRLTRQYVIQKCNQKRYTPFSNEEAEFRFNIMNVSVVQIADISPERCKYAKLENHAGTKFEDRLTWQNRKNVSRAVKVPGKQQWGLDYHKFSPTSVDKLVRHKLINNLLTNI